MQNPPSALLSIVAILLLACSGHSSSREKEEQTGGSSGTGGSGGQPGPDDASNYPCAMESCPVIGDRVQPQPKPVCPAPEPEETAACDSEGLRCSYGESLSSYCRRYFECAGGRWIVPERRGAPCVEQPPGFCPDEPSRGAACTVGEVNVFVPCEYERGIVCYCLGNPIGVQGAAGEWECYGPPPNGACPEVLPNLGDGCASTGLTCHYGVASEGCYSPYGEAFCYQGAWEAASPVCPL